MKLVVTAERPTPILWRRASGLASPTEVPASTLPGRANIASRSVVLPLWNGPTSAMHRGPRGLLTSCPIAASSSGARPLIGSAAGWSPYIGVLASRKYDAAMSMALHQPGEGACAPRRRERRELGASPAITARPLRRDHGSAPLKSILPSRPKFQALQTGRDIEADLALQAQRLQRDRIVRAADQHIAACPDADRSTALRAGVVARKVAGPEPGDRRPHAPRQRRFLGDADINAYLADGRHVAVLRHALDAQHATEISNRADDEADAGAAAAFEHANLHPIQRRLRVGAGKGCDKQSDGDPGKDG